MSHAHGVIINFPPGSEFKNLTEAKGHQIRSVNFATAKGLLFDSCMFWGLAPRIKCSCEEAQRFLFVDVGVSLEGMELSIFFKETLLRSR